MISILCNKLDQGSQCLFLQFLNATLVIWRYYNQLKVEQCKARVGNYDNLTTCEPQLLEYPSQTQALLQS